MDPKFAGLLLVLAIGHGTLLSIWAIMLEEVSLRRYPRRRGLMLMLRFAVLESPGYRQMTVWFRLQAFWKYFRGEQGWGVMKREGFARK